MSSIEYRTFECRLAGDQGAISGDASTFGGPPDSYGDVIRAGAFSKSLAEHRAAGRLPSFLWQHDSQAPIGRWTEMRETASGLKVRGQLTRGVAKAEEALLLLKDGALDGLSIGFKARASEPLKGGGRELTNVSLMEVSLVTFPANEGARVTAVKSALMEGRVPSRAEMADGLRTLGLSRRQVNAFLSRGHSGLMPDDQAELLEAIERARMTMRGGRAD